MYNPLRPLVLHILPLVGAVAGGVACSFDLEPLRTQGVGMVDSGANAAGSGGAGGTPHTAGTAGRSDPENCEADQKRCGTTCVSRDDPAFGCEDSTCEPCGTGAAFACNEGACAIASCEGSRFDCDGEIQNGCEEVFASNPVIEPFPAIQRTIQSLADWATVPTQPLTEVCRECEQDFPRPAVEEPGTLPEGADLQAQLSVAWNPDWLFVKVAVRDDSLEVDGSAINEDGIQLLFDGLDDKVGFGPDDHNVYVGASGIMDEPNRIEPAANEATVTVAKGAGCYVIAARFKFDYLFSSAPSPVLPAIGARYGFSIAVNDWDDDVRQSQVFWQSPGNEYWHFTSSYSAIELISGP